MGKKKGLWVAVSVQVGMSRLALEGSAEAFKLWVIGLTIARQHQTSGDLIPSAACRLAGVSPAAIDELVEMGSWHRRDHGCNRCPNPPEGRLQIHDYLEWQDSPEDIDGRSAASRNAARKRWAMRSASDPQCDPECDRDAELELEQEQEVVLPNASRSGTAGKPASARKRATSTPPKWLTGNEPMPESLTRWLGEQQVTNEDWVRRQSADMVDWVAANGKSYKDWEAAWRGWIRRSLQFAQQRRGSSGNGEDLEQQLREWLRVHPCPVPAELEGIEGDDVAFHEAMKPVRAAWRERGLSELRRGQMRAL